MHACAYVCVHACVRVCVSLSLSVYASEGWRRPEEGTGNPGAGVPGADELSIVGGGNSVQVLCRSSQHAPLSSLLSPAPREEYFNYI